MKKMTTLFGLVLVSFAVHAEVHTSPSVTQYCSQHGSVMEVQKADDDKFKILLKKNDRNYTLLAPVTGISFGGQADIQEKQELLRSKKLIANGVVVNTVNSYSLSTLLSNQSSIKALNTLSEITVTSEAKIGVLYSNGTIVFIGSESLCR